MNGSVASGQNMSVEPSLRARVRAGDPDAFAELFDKHAPAVYRYAAGLTGNWSAAEEVVSLTFLEAWRLRQTVTPDGGSLRPWLLGIAVNVTRNQARAARRHQAALSRVAPPPDLPDFAEELTERLDDRDRLAALRAAVRGLPPRERDVLICVWSGLDSAEAARALGVPEGTVRTRLSRARRHLRALAADAAPQSGPPQAGLRRVGPRNDPGPGQEAVQRLSPIRPADRETP
jgi:RNA polymerase sigma factor (sigma-70 family)